jgi:hypothetical protein
MRYKGKIITYSQSDAASSQCTNRLGYRIVLSVSFFICPFVCQSQAEIKCVKGSLTFFYMNFCVVADCSM